MKDFYLVREQTSNRWVIEIQETFQDGTPVDVWAYMQCKWLQDPKTVPFKVRVDGRKVDYNPTAFCTIVVSRRMAELITRAALDDIQRIPATIGDQANDWEVLNVLTCADCIDHHNSIIQYYPPDHPRKPDEPRGVIKLMVDPSRVGDHHILRPKGWRVEAIVSGYLKELLEGINATGIDFIPVTEDAFTKMRMTHVGRLGKR